MEDVTRKRILRKLESLPEDRLYQVLDYIEFMEARYAAESLRKPDPFQQFAERVEDQMRVRALAPKAMKGTMRIMSTAGRVIDGVKELGRDLTSPPATPARPGRPASDQTPASGRPSADVTGKEGS